MSGSRVAPRGRCPSLKGPRLPLPPGFKDLCKRLSALLAFRLPPSLAPTEPTSLISLDLQRVKTHYRPWRMLASPQLYGEVS